MKKLAAALMSAVAMLVLCFGLVGCDLFGGGASKLTPSDLDGEYKLVSFKDGGATYKVGDMYKEKEVEAATVIVRLNNAGAMYEDRMGAMIMCSVTDHVYYFTGNCVLGKNLTFNGAEAESMSGSGTQTSFTGSYKDGTITINHKGVTINVKRPSTTE